MLAPSVNAGLGLGQPRASKVVVTRCHLCVPISLELLGERRLVWYPLPCKSEGVGISLILPSSTYAPSYPQWMVLENELILKMIKDAKKKKGKKKELES